MSVTLKSPPSSFLSSSLPKSRLRFANGSSSSTLLFKFNRSFPVLRASSGLSTELDAVSTFSEIVPDTVIFDDFEKFPPTAATVSSSLLLGILSLPDTIFRNAVDMALADSTCSPLDNPAVRLSCFVNKVRVRILGWNSNWIALVNVGGDLAKLVPGRVSTEVDARLAYDTHGIIRRVHCLLRLYDEIAVPPERLLFKIPSTWQGIEASRLLESEGIQTHLTFVYSFAQAAAAAQAGASVIQIFVGRVRDWARSHSGDPEIEAAIQRGEDPGLALVTKAYNYIHKYGHKSKLMAAAVRNKQDIFSLLGVDYIIAPLKVLQSLKESITSPDEKYSYDGRLSPQSAARYDFTAEEVCFLSLSQFLDTDIVLTKWDQLSLASAMGPASVELLAAGLDGYINQTKRVEELLDKIWPPPNV
ncbi:transaldolase-like [Gossypium australe]|uniref:transaldolase n=1 Tax=Gossypium australe TaxID=47621 RepID=A0A5B6UEI7_9ROSI|nr:transaldolase-like [Gossypium australe]